MHSNFDYKFLYASINNMEEEDRVIKVMVSKQANMCRKIVGYIGF